MGSYVEINDTLQITKEQGFPEELDWKKHLKKQIHIYNAPLKIWVVQYIKAKKSIK